MIKMIKIELLNRRLNVYLDTDKVSNSDLSIFFLFVQVSERNLSQG